MKPKEKEYDKEVVIPKVWEEIDKSHHLVTEPVSEYIRRLEKHIEDLIKYATHDTRCRMMLNLGTDPSFGPYPCDCGHDELLNKLK